MPSPASATRDTTTPSPDNLPKIRKASVFGLLKKATSGLFSSPWNKAASMIFPPFRKNPHSFRRPTPAWPNNNTAHRQPCPAASCPLLPQPRATTWQPTYTATATRTIPTTARSTFGTTSNFGACPASSAPTIG